MDYKMRIYLLFYMTGMFILMEKLSMLFSVCKCMCLCSCMTHVPETHMHAFISLCVCVSRSVFSLVHGSQGVCGCFDL